MAPVPAGLQKIAVENSNPPRADRSTPVLVFARQLSDSNTVPVSVAAFLNSTCESADPPNRITPIRRREPVPTWAAAEAGTVWVENNGEDAPAVAMGVPPAIPSTTSQIGCTSMGMCTSLQSHVLDELLYRLVDQRPAGTQDALLQIFKVCIFQFQDSPAGFRQDVQQADGSAHFLVVGALAVGRGAQDLGELRVVGQLYGSLACLRLHRFQ